MMEHGSCHIFKARTNTSEVRERKAKWRGENDKCNKCEKKGEMMIETLEHLIREREAYNEEKNRDK